MKTTFLILVASIGFLTSCGKKEKKSQPTVSSEAFLTSADIQKGVKLKELSSTEAKKMIEDDSDFYDDNPNTGKTDCLSKKLDELVVKAGTTSVEFGSEIDVTACFQTEFTADYPGWKVSNGKFRVAFSYDCDEGDFSSYDGKSYGEVRNSLDLDRACGESSTISNMLNMQVSVSLGTTASNRNYSAQVVANYSNSMADLKPCTAKIDGDTITYENGCLNVSRSVITSAKVNGVPTDFEGENDFKQLTYRNLESTVGENKWYKNGGFDVTLNKWSGSVAYAGVTTNPTYSLANGSNTISGTIYGPTSGLRALDSSLGAALPSDLKLWTLD